MRKFIFKLDSVLSIRQGIEKEWEGKLSKASGECEVIKNKIATFKDKLIKSQGLERDLANVELKAIYEARLLQQIENTTTILKEKEFIRDDIKKTYLEKSTQRKVIDKLKEKSKSRYKKYSLKEESLMIDEINSASKIREKMLEGVS